MAGSAGLVSACGAGLDASAPHPPRKIARDRRLSEKFRGILHLRAAPTPWPSLKMDGLIPASLAHEQSLCEVFSIIDLPLYGRLPPLARASHLSPVCRAHPSLQRIRAGPIKCLLP